LRRSAVVSPLLLAGKHKTVAVEVIATRAEMRSDERAQAQQPGSALWEQIPTQPVEKPIISTGMEVKCSGAV
jgi:hypothetical protein